MSRLPTGAYTPPTRRNSTQLDRKNSQRVQFPNFRRQSSRASCEFNTHRRCQRDSIRQLSRVGGVYWALYEYSSPICISECVLSLVAFKEMNAGNPTIHKLTLYLLKLHSLLLHHSCCSSKTILIRNYVENFKKLKYHCTY